MQLARYLDNMGIDAGLRRQSRGNRHQAGRTVAGQRRAYRGSIDAEADAAAPQVRHEFIDVESRHGLLARERDWVEGVVGDTVADARIAVDAASRCIEAGNTGGKPYRAVSTRGAQRFGAGIEQQLLQDRIVEAGEIATGLDQSIDIGQQHAGTGGGVGEHCAVPL